VHDVSFSIPRGGGLLVSGGEGAGKTSVLRAVLGLTRFSGQVSVLGGAPGDPTVARRVGYAPQTRDFMEGHTPRAMVRLIVAIRAGRNDASGVEAALDQAGLPVARRDARVLDIEESRRVALACALVGSPDLLVLDDPWEFPETVEAIRAARARGAAVLAATHLPGGFPEVLGTTLDLPDEAGA